MNPVASLASSQPPPLPLTLSALVEILAAETSPRFDFLLLYAEWLKNASRHTVELRRPRYATGFFEIFDSPMVIHVINLSRRKKN